MTELERPEELPEGRRGVRSATAAAGSAQPTTGHKGAGGLAAAASTAIPQRLRAPTIGVGPTAWNATIKALSSNVITAPCRLFACSTVGFLRTSDMCIGQALYRRAKALKIHNITREFIGKPMLDTDLTHLGAEALSIFCVI